MSTLRISASRFSACEYSEALRFSRWLERYLQCITQKRYQHMCLDALFQRMEERADGQFALERAKCRFDFRQLHVLLPEICSTVYCQIRTQEIGSLARFQPLLLL